MCSMSKISPSYVRRNLYNILDWVVRGCNRTRIHTKHGDAILVSAEEFEHMKIKSDLMAADSREAAANSTVLAAVWEALPRIGPGLPAIGKVLP